MSFSTVTFHHFVNNSWVFGMKNVFVCTWMTIDQMGISISDRKHWDSKEAPKKLFKCAVGGSHLSSQQTQSQLTEITAVSEMCVCVCEILSFLPMTLSSSS